MNKPLLIIKCAYCESQFQQKKPKAKYCSDKCRVYGNRKKNEVITKQEPINPIVETITPQVKVDKQEYFIQVKKISSFEYSQMLQNSISAEETKEIAKRIREDENLTVIEKKNLFISYNIPNK